MTLLKAEQLIVAAIYTLADAEGLAPMLDENAPFDLEAHGDDPWYRVTTLPGRPTFREVGTNSRKRQVGIVQVDVFYPGGTYKGKAKTDAQTIIDAFPSSRHITGDTADEVVRIRESWYETRGSGAGGAVPDAWYHVPVSIAWIADVDDV